jgi:hypothetical protein
LDFIGFSFTIECVTVRVYPLTIRTYTTSLKISFCYHQYFLLQVQEFEHINGYYSMPEMIRKPIEPIKVGSGAVPPGIEQGGEMPRSATTSTSATPATSAAASPAPTLNSQDESKDKEVRTPPYFDFVDCALLKDRFYLLAYDTMYSGTYLPAFWRRPLSICRMHCYVPLVVAQSAPIDHCTSY